MNANHPQIDSNSGAPAAVVSTPSLVDNKSLAIGVLAITAAILFVGFLMLSFRPAPAYGIGQNDRGGDYVMLTQQIGSNIEGVVVIDAAAKRMSVYALDHAAKQLKVLQSNVPLNRLPGQKADEEKKP